MNKVLAVLASFVVVLAGIAHADVIASWDVNGVTVSDGTGIDEAVSPYRFTSPSLLLHITDAKISLSPSMSPTSAGNMYGGRAPSQENTLADAIAAAHYIQFSVTVENGFRINFQNIEMNGQTTGTGWSNAVFMTEIAGYTSGNEIDTVLGINGVTGGLDTDASGWGAPIDLSSASYQGVTGTTTFRIYGWGATSSSGNNNIRNLTGDDFVINGTVVAIPEPTTMAFLGFGLASVLVARRKLRK